MNNTIKISTPADILPIVNTEADRLASETNRVVAAIEKYLAKGQLIIPRTRSAFPAEAIEAAAELYRAAGWTVVSGGRSSMLIFSKAA